MVNFLMSKKFLSPSSPFSILKKTQKEMTFPAPANAAFPSHPSLFFSHTPFLKGLLPSFLKKSTAFFKGKKGGLFLCFFLGTSGVTLSAYRLLALQEKRDEMAQDLRCLEEQLRCKKKDLTFLKENRRDLEPQQYWEQQKKLTRFEIGEALKILSQKAGFQGMTFTVMPEKKISLKTGIPAVVTKISVSYKTNSDAELVLWISSLSTYFKAFLVPRHLTIERANAEIRDDASVFEGVEGIYIFDWVRLEK